MVKLYPVYCCNKLVAKVRGIAELQCKKCKTIFTHSKEGRVINKTKESSLEPSSNGQLNV